MSNNENLPTHKQFIKLENDPAKTNESEIQRML